MSFKSLINLKSEYFLYIQDKYFVMMMITMMIILRSSFLTEFHELSRCLRHLLLKVVDSECSKLIFLHTICLSLDENHTACPLNIHPLSAPAKILPSYGRLFMFFYLVLLASTLRSATYLMMFNKYAFFN